MESTLVIKVKFGDTLRRFNARVNENEQLDLDMAGLQAKILSLFSFPPDANYILRYVDEDGDLVALVDDDDLCDVMRQHLKFLRIDVEMKNDKGGKSLPRSSGNSTPLSSPQMPVAFQHVNTGLSDVLKSVPEPVRESLSKLSQDLAAKTASSSPKIAEFLECFPSVGQYFLTSDSQPQVGADSIAKGGVSESTVPPVDTVPNTKALDSTVKTSEKVDSGNVTTGVGEAVSPVSTSVDLNLHPCDLQPYQFTYVNSSPFAPKVHAGNDRKESEMKLKDVPNGQTGGCGASTSSAVPYAGPFKTIETGSSPLIECPFSGMPMYDSALPSVGNFRVSPFKRSYSHTESMGGIFHKGVQCDGCGVYPITGPRFKSKVKENYDLCSICFNEMGSDADYTRMDRPVSYRHPRSFKGLYEQHPWTAPPTLPTLFTDCAMKQTRPKLDSRFIFDVNVIDGTIMAPSTPFTKIWRMRNNGTLVWPQGTRLVWIGGDRLCDADSAEIKIPVEGLRMEKELEIAVECRAPESPGRYISYWRMASPSGQKFGQRVWVLIMVDAFKESFCDIFQGLNLNYPPECSGSKGPEVTDNSVPPVLNDMLIKPRNSNAPAEPAKQIIDKQHTEEQESSFPINETSLVGDDTLVPATPEALSLVSHPIIDFSDTAPAAPTNAQSSVFNASTSSEGVDANNPVNTVEETLLKELEEMGFKQVLLNKEILRMNEYNLEQSLDDLCGVSEWDPILEELQEMGFHDNEVNRKLLVKNNGSIKRVVMDLINGENA
ncbi:protein NBR1-like [Quillaja saponaria]|uniref:Protein NBR1-like n=1 Tax=Quillaja saponaria TaxID=32244 RepID=A0AAD7KTZ9_QUISA|nr:protein NBR1-like [Quillaja saponaria]